jgi:hypothetical protein
MRAASPSGMGWRINQLFDKFHIKIARNFTIRFPSYIIIRHAASHHESENYFRGKRLFRWQTNSRPKWWKANIWRRMSNCSMISFSMRNLALLTCLHFGACLSDEFNDCTHTGWANRLSRVARTLISIPSTHSFHPFWTTRLSNIHYAHNFALGLHYSWLMSHFIIVNLPTTGGKMSSDGRILHTQMNRRWIFHVERRENVNKPRTGSSGLLINARKKLF